MSPLAAYVVAAWVVDRATEVVGVLEPRLNWRADRQLPLRSLLIGKEMLGLLGLRSHHRQVLAALTSLPYPLQRKLGVVSSSGREITYREIEKAMGQIADILANPEVLVPHDHPVADADTGEVFLCPVQCPYIVADDKWYLTAMAHAAIPDDIPRSPDAAMDWSDVEGHAKPLFAFARDVTPVPGDGPGDEHFDALNIRATSDKDSVPAEGDTPADAPVPDKDSVPAEGSTPDEVPAPAEGQAPADDSTPDKVPAPASAAKTNKAPRDANNRAIPTKDEDARWGHRSRRPGVSEYFTGWDNHSAVMVRGRDGTMYAPFTVGSLLVPAGSYPGDAAVALLRAARHHGTVIRDLITDRGYTNLAVDRFARPVHELVEDVVQDLFPYQWKRKVDYIVVRNRGTADERTIQIICTGGGYFASSLPEMWHNLERPAPNATQAERAENRLQFDMRGAYAFVRHGHTDAGTPRWAGPATPHARFRVRCVNNPRSMRAPYERPQTGCVLGTPCSCGDVVAIQDPTAEKERQDLMWGTTKWTLSNNRRTAVEREYADHTVQVTRFKRGSICCFGTVKQALYYSPIVVARNVQVAMRWYRDEGQPSPWNLDEISRPDYALSKELGGDDPADTPEAPTIDGPCSCGRSAPEPAAQAVSADDGDDAADGYNPTEDGGTAEDGAPHEVVAQAVKSGPNREQRRLAEKSRKKGRAAVSKPPKPPPQDTTPPDRQ
ncbi:MAG: hypothetical protein ACR2GF_05050 [Acidimicrobiales bacterium]